MRKQILSHVGLWWLLAALTVRFLFWVWPYAYERVYFEVCYPAIRWLQYALYSWVPLPGFYLLALALLAWGVWRVPRRKRRAEWLKFVRRLANLLGGLAASFLLLWGYNYLDRGVADRMALERGTEAEPIAEAYLETMERAYAFRNQIHVLDTVTTIEDIDLNVHSNDITLWVSAILKPLGYPCQPEPKVVYLKPDGVLRRMSIAGIYNPWTGEANVDNANSSLPRIFTTAHELAHAYGVTSEAEANFVAYLACLSADHPAANYAAEYALWRSLAQEVTPSYPEEVVRALIESIPAGLQKDREAIWAKATNYRGYFPAVTETMNDTFLKIQGIEAGVEDYNAFVGLVLAWQKQNKGPVLKK